MSKSDYSHIGDSVRTLRGHVCESFAPPFLGSNLEVCFLSTAKRLAGVGCQYAEDWRRNPDINDHSILSWCTHVQERFLVGMMKNIGSSHIMEFTI